MATLDDKLLGEKKHYYCDESDDEEKRGDLDSEGPKMTRASLSNLTSNVNPDAEEWKGYSTNTGPKGVIKDFQRWKQLEAEKKVETEAERLSLAKKLSMVCKTVNEDEEDKKLQESLDVEMEDLLKNSDPFLEEYMKKRMEEMMSKKNESRKIFGRVIKLSSGSEFLSEIEKENSSDVCVVCHIFSYLIPECIIINKYLDELSARFKQTKFCSIEVASVGMSQHFESKGVPAILVYRKGTLIGNFVRITDSLTENFEAEDLQNFLVEHGFLPDPSCVPEIITEDDDGYTRHSIIRSSGRLDDGSDDDD